MLSKVSRILKTAQVAKGAQNAVFNARLPISILVLKKFDGSKYLLQVGSKQIQTSSHTPLQIGQKYWANMGSLSNMGGAQIVLNGLIAQPKILDFAQKFGADFVLDSQSLEQILQESELFKGLGEFALSRLADAKSKAEFEYFSFVLLGLQKKVASFLVQDDSGKAGMLQVRKGSRELAFNACMPTLGVIDGVICWVDSVGDGVKMSLRIACNFESTKSLLESSAAELQDFESVSFALNKALTPLFEPKDYENIIDVMG